MRSSLISLEFRRRRESLFENIKNEKVSASMRPGSPSRAPCPTTVSQPIPRYASLHARFSTLVHPAMPACSGRPRLSLPHAHTRTHTHMHTGHTHATPTRGDPRASSPVPYFTLLWIFF